jgi:UDP-glucose:(heptosyl)LPS alpha-1,3-glucosyltransferase
VLIVHPDELDTSEASAESLGLKHLVPGDEGDYGPLEQAERLRIAIVSPEVGPGAGVPYYWQSLALAMAKQHEVHIFAAKTDRVSLDGVTAHRIWALMMGWFLLHTTFYFSILIRFFCGRLLKRRPFDLVFGIGAITPFADVATVHFVQARELDLQEKGMFPRERTLTGLAGLDYALYSRTMGWLGRRFYRRSDTQIVAISESGKRDIELFEGASAAAVTVVPNGVDTSRFHPANRERYRDALRKELGMTDHHIMVLFVGNSWGRKGLCTAVEAIRGPGSQNIRLVVVGQGVPSVFLRGLPIEDSSRILFAGNQKANVERFYAAADVFILPTLYEPFGLVILEALASGLPTIVSASAGASEWLTDGVDALLLHEPHDGEEARAALSYLLDRPALAATLSVNGRRTAEAFQWQTVADGLIAVAKTHRAARNLVPSVRQEAVVPALLK